MTNAIDRGAARPPLPILEIVTLAYRVLLTQPGAWLAALVIPLAIELAVQVAFLALYGPELVRAMLRPETADPMMQVRGIGVQLCILIAYALFAVSWHRFMLLGPGERPRVLPPILGRHMRFAGMTIGLSLLIGLIVAVPFFIILLGKINSVIALIGVAVLAGALFVRWQLIFPAIALDRTLSLGEAWRRSRGYGLKLFWGLLLSALPWVLLSALVDQLTEGPQTSFIVTGEPNAGALAALLVTGLLGYAMVAVLVGTLSGAYRALVLEGER